MQELKACLCVSHTAAKLCLCLCSAAFSPAMENHISSPINSGTLDYKSGLPPISPRSFSPLPKHLLGGEDVNRLDGFSFLR